MHAVTEIGENILVSSPTGSGKSHIEGEAMATLDGLGYSVGLITSRTVIVDDIREKLKVHGLDPRRIPVATPRTFWNLIERGEIVMPEVLAADEAHRGLAPTWRRLLDYELEDGRRPKIVGFTATPMRGIESEDPQWRGLWHRFYEAINIGQAIREGYLVPFYLIREVHGTLGKVEGKSERLQNMASERLVRDKIRYIFDVMNRLDPTRPTVYVCPTIKAARVVMEHFNLYRLHTPGCQLPPVEEVVDETHPKVRKRIFKQLAHNEISVAAVNILTEGVDIPEISRVVILRESSSAIITVQSYGRGLRVVRNPESPMYGRKGDCEIVDFTNNVHTFKRKLEDLCGIQLVPAPYVLYPDLRFQSRPDELLVTDEENYVNVDLEPVPTGATSLPHGQSPAHVRLGRSLTGGNWVLKLFMGGESRTYVLSHDRFNRKTVPNEPADFRVRVGGRDDLALNMLARIAGPWKQVTQEWVRLSELLGYSLLQHLERTKKTGGSAGDHTEKWRAAQRFLRALPTPADVRESGGEA